MNKEITNIDLVEGGNVVKQGDYFTIGYRPRNAKGEAVDLVGKSIAVEIFSKDGIAFESTGEFDPGDGLIYVHVNKNIGYGNMFIEFTVTDPNDAGYRLKFPTNNNAGRLTIHRSTDDLEYVGVKMVTVEQLKADQRTFEQTVDGKVETLKQRVDTGIGAFTSSTEILDARGGEVNLRARLDKTTAQLADTEKRVDTIITTPATGISQQEIIDARTSEGSLGAKIRKMDKNTSDISTILAGNFSEEKLSETGVVAIPSNAKSGIAKFTILGKSEKDASGILNHSIVTSFKDGTVVSSLPSPITLRGINPSVTGSRDSLENTGKIVRRVGSLTINGNNSIEKSGTQFAGVTRLFASNLNPPALYDAQKRAVNAVSSFGIHQEVASFSAPNSFRMYSDGSGSVLFSLDDAKTGLNKDSTLADFKAYLNLNPITIFYQRTSEAYATEQIPQIEVPISAGNNFEAVSVIKPYVRAEYGIVRDILTLKKADVLLKSDADLVVNSKMNRFSSYYEVPLIPKGHPIDHHGVYKLYDDTMAAANGYITKQALGNTATGLPMFSYKFSKPNVPNNVGIERIKIGIISGLHGDERTPVVGLHNFMHNLTINGTNNEILDRLKSAIDFYVIPLGCPWGWNNNSRFNSNEVNINRNFDVPSWTAGEQNPGVSPASELETKYIQTWMEVNDFDYYFDFHTADMGTGDIASWFTSKDTDLDLRNAYWKALSLLSTLYPRRYPYFPQNTVFGHTNSYPYLAQSQRYAEKIGVKSALLEVSAYLRYTTGDIFQLGNTWAAEIVGNYIFELLRKHI